MLCVRWATPAECTHTAVSLLWHFHHGMIAAHDVSLDKSHYTAPQNVLTLYYSSPNSVADVHVLLLLMGMYCKC